MILESLLSLVCSFGVTAVNIFIQWFFIYRTDSYKKQISRIDKEQEELDDLKGKTSVDDKKGQKKIQKLEESIRGRTSAISMSTMKFTFGTSVFSLLVNMLLKSLFISRVCCKIPFEPINLIRKISHAGIDTEDSTDAGFQFIFWLGQIFFRDVINRYYDFRIPRMTAMMPKVPNMPQ